MTDHIAPDLDRVALSAELWTLATRYSIEATMAEHRADAELIARAARQLNEVARQVLTVGDIQVADAYARAAHLHISLIEGSRRAMWALTAPARLVCKTSHQHYLGHQGMPAHVWMPEVVA
jgi:hypothetical protein